MTDIDDDQQDDDFERHLNMAIGERAAARNKKLDQKIIDMEEQRAQRAPRRKSARKALLIERKGIDPIRLKNYVRLLLTSNEKWVVPAGEDERRFAVLDVGRRCQGNHEYFRELTEQLDDGGLTHLLGALLRFDLATVNLREIPRTEALLDQKVHTLDSVASWWLARLRAGAPTSCSTEWADVVPVDALFNDYILVCEKIGIRRKRDETVFGKELRELMPESVDGPPGLRRARLTEVENDVAGKTRRVWKYILPTLSEAREHFERYVGQPYEWPEEKSEENAS
jgi:hypothetical protein